MSQLLPHLYLKGTLICYEIQKVKFKHQTSNPSRTSREVVKPTTGETCTKRIAVAEHRNRK